MARPREFDPEAALATAMNLFWEKGFALTTIDDLVAATGVARASLYSTFGDKRRLYLSALEHYVNQRCQAAEELLCRSPGRLKGVEILMRNYADDALAGPGLGCLVVKSAVALADSDREIAEVVSASWARLEQLIARALTDARDAQELAADRDPVALARMVVVLLQGLRVIATVSPPRALVESAVSQTIDAIRR